MSRYNFDKYAVPNKYIEESFESLADLCEQCENTMQKAQKVLTVDTCPQFESKEEKV